MYLFKQLVSPLFFPVTLCLALVLPGLFFLWFTRRQKTGRILVGLGTILLALLGCGLVSERLLQPLEARYPPFLSGPEHGAASTVPGGPVRWVVVLSGGHVPDPALPVTSQISNLSLVRLVEGIRLYRETPGSKLVLMGGGPCDSVSEAETMASVARSIGVDPEALVIEDKSKDTKDQARSLRSIVGNDRFILVTSSWHMPRSMAMFRKLGLDPIPAPTGHMVKEGAARGPTRLFPSSAGLGKAEIAIHEYLGLLWAKLRGQV